MASPARSSAGSSGSGWRRWRRSSRWHGVASRTPAAVRVGRKAAAAAVAGGEGSRRVACKAGRTGTGGRSSGARRVAPWRWKWRGGVSDGIVSAGAGWCRRGGTGGWRRRRS